MGSGTSSYAYLQPHVQHISIHVYIDSSCVCGVCVCVCAVYLCVWCVCARSVCVWCVCACVCAVYVWCVVCVCVCVCSVCVVYVWCVCGVWCVCVCVCCSGCNPLLPSWYSSADSNSCTNRTLHTDRHNTTVEMGEFVSNSPISSSTTWQ